MGNHLTVSIQDRSVIMSSDILRYRTEVPELGDYMPLPEIGERKARRLDHALGSLMIRRRPGLRVKRPPGWFVRYSEDLRIEQYWNGIGARP